jgi:hypothetical protein
MFRSTELKDPLTNPGLAFRSEGSSFIFQLALGTVALVLFSDTTKDITAYFEDPSGQVIKPVPPP